MRGAPFLNLVLAVALALMLGWLLVVGRSLLLPIIAATICVYVLTEAGRVMGEVPVLRALPPMLRLVILLFLFSLVFLALGLVVAATVDDFIAAMPRYQANLEAMSGRVAERLGLDLPPTWEEAANLLFAKVDLQATFIFLIGGITRFGLSAFLVVVYAGFIMAEWTTLAARPKWPFPPMDSRASSAPSSSKSTVASAAILRSRRW